MQMLAACNSKFQRNLTDDEEIRKMMLFKRKENMPSVMRSSLLHFRIVVGPSGKIERSDISGHVEDLFLGSGNKIRDQFWRAFSALQLNTRCFKFDRFQMLAACNSKLLANFEANTPVGGPSCFPVEPDCNLARAHSSSKRRVLRTPPPLSFWKGECHKLMSKSKKIGQSATRKRIILSESTVCREAPVCRPSLPS